MAANLITLAEVASQCRVTTRTVRNWIADGKLPAFKIGGGWRCEQATVTRFIKAGEKRCQSISAGTSGGFDSNSLGKKSGGHLSRAINEALNGLNGS